MTVTAVEGITTGEAMQVLEERRRVVEQALRGAIRTVADAQQLRRQVEQEIAAIDLALQLLKVSR